MQNVAVSGTAVMFKCINLASNQYYIIKWVGAGSYIEEKHSNCHYMYRDFGSDWV